ncbi:TetR/AcrR family transcriptional regulator [Streptomyces boncukensis]|uniref:TetR/AcrR family transcriptional regulator n=1 Tax=Streptomyces boncukensis TaxID=2711219 RepID=A0A6G4X2D1_9ACTN|nr:TetR/AcrR family transcriptional regulator [Streptomyces boncukensis]NGO71699.1 TetR/AcrR family transcriptional regulator [Streptomyces boncukensis]
MATGQRADARASRERLLAAAREVFAESGPDASLNEVAKRAGVGPGTLYRHFPRRQALLAALLQDRVEKLRTLAGALSAPDADPDDALARWLHAFLAHARVNQGLGGTLLTEEPSLAEELEALGLDCHRTIRDAAARLLDRAQRHGTARADLSAGDVVQLVAGIALSTARTGEPDRSERLLGLVLDAVWCTPRAAGAPWKQRLP